MSTIISLCDEPGCASTRRARGLCSMHYQRLMKTGTTAAPPRKTPSERFWEKVNKTPDCWVWTAATYSNGYGHFGLSAERGAIAHRFAWEELRGPIPDGALLDHICHNRLCVNPQHLRIATHKQNVENMGVLRADNTSGVRGVHRHSSGRYWVTRVEHFGKVYSAGLFRDLSAAEAAVVKLRNKLYTHNDLDRKSP